MAKFDKNFNVYDMIDDDYDMPVYQKIKNKRKKNVYNRKRAKG